MNERLDMENFLSEESRPDLWTEEALARLGAFRPGDVAEVLCSDGEWRQATLRTRVPGGTSHGVTEWVFPTGGRKRVDSCEARPVSAS